MNVFAQKLKELMAEESIDAQSLYIKLGLKDSTIIYRWLQGKKGLSLPTAIKIADYFNCSLDYLFGRSADYGNSKYVECPPFDEQLRRVLEEQRISQYRLTKNKIISGGNIDSWLNKMRTPNIESIIKLADYLKVSMDYLTGREI